MFKKQLSIQMLKAIDEKELTLESLSETAGLSRKFVGNIISGKQVPTLDSFERICSALELEPNDLLLSEKSKKPNKSKPMRVAQVYCREEIGGFSYVPICPYCNTLLKSEHQSYCDVCGQRLKWDKYREADLTTEKPKRSFVCERNYKENQ